MEKNKKGKYPSKGMNALAKKRPDVAKKIMGYKEGGRAAEMKETAMKRAKVKEQLFGAKQRFEEAKRTKKAMGGPVEVKADNAVDEVGNPKGKKKPIQIAGWGKARH